MIDARQISISGQGVWWLVHAFWKKNGRLKEFFAVPDGSKWFSVLCWSFLSMFESSRQPKQWLSRNQSYLSDAFSRIWTHFAFRTEYRRFIALSVSLSFRNRVEEVKNDLGCTVNHLEASESAFWPICSKSQCNCAWPYQEVEECQDDGFRCLSHLLR